MPSIYNNITDSETAEVVEQMRNKLANEFGVTVVGNRCTVRWTMDGQLVDVHMIMESVTTPQEVRDATEQRKRYEALLKKYPNLGEEMYFVEHGEHSK